MFFVEEFHHLKIQLQDAILATDNFNPNNLIGTGGFGPVYKGELSLPEGRCIAAFKRLDGKFGQGNTEFWKEIMMLTKCKHENLVSLLHFCFEGDERILVYEYASRGSLDSHLSDISLTWLQRLKICLGVARGLNYLHDPMETKQRVLHRDIKSSNILLDEEWNAKVSDFGLSKVGPANQPHTYLVSNPVGTFGYCDPSYFETGLLSKESDVYSFGVVLFEVMCGRLCCESENGEKIRILVPMWRECFEENKLDDIVFHGLKEQIQHDSLMTFSSIANQCLQRDHKKRPTMAKIVQELEVAIKQQTGVNSNEEIKHTGVKLQGTISERGTISATTTSPGGGSLPISGSEEDFHLLYQRKRKRKISNRESARRSRFKVRHRLEELETQVDQLREENNQIKSRVSITTQHYVSMEKENSVLRAQLAELNHRLQWLNEIMFHRKP